MLGRPVMDAQLPLMLGLVLVALGTGCSCHAPEPTPPSPLLLCPGSRTPVVLGEELSFCGYRGMSCCDAVDDAALREEFLGMLKDNTSGVASDVKAALCATKCLPFLPPDAESSTPPRTPGLGACMVLLGAFTLAFAVYLVYITMFAGGGEQTPVVAASCDKCCGGSSVMCCVKVTNENS